MLLMHMTPDMDDFVKSNRNNKDLSNSIFYYTEADGMQSGLLDSKIVSRINSSLFEKDKWSEKNLIIFLRHTKSLVEVF